MTNLIIRMKNGVPFEHPILLENFVQCFPEVDIANLPGDYKFFERVDRPHPGLYEVLDPPESVYTLIDNVVKDVWNIRSMTTEEKQAKMDAVLAQDHLAGWLFSEETCAWEPPVPRPTDGKQYMWNEETESWEEAPPPEEEVLP